MFSLGLLVLFIFLAWKAAPRERAEDTHVHGAGQIGLLAAVALFGVDYFTSYYYATGELMSALHPYGLQKYAYIGVAFIALANFAFGALYLFAIGVFNEGGGSYTASMRYLTPGLSLVVAVVLIQDYTLTIVVSALSGGDQLLSILNCTAQLGLAFPDRGRPGSPHLVPDDPREGESSHLVTFILLGIFIELTVVMAAGLFVALSRQVPAAGMEAVEHPTVRQALYHMLTATMKGIVALSGLEAVSNGIQFFKHEDFALVRWGKTACPRLNWLWRFYSGKSGIGRVVQTAFLFYGCLTTLFLTYFSLHFNVFDGTFGRSLVGNLSFIGFTQIPGGTLLFWAYQILAVALLAAASMTALQDAQATEWRDVAIGEIPEVIIYRDKRGTFTRSVTITFLAAVVIMLLVRGRTSVAVPFYGVGVFMPIMVMGFAVRRHILANSHGAQAGLGRGRGDVRRSAGGHRVRRPDRGQVVGRWVGGPDLVLGPGPRRPLDPRVADWLPYPEADPPHRPGEGSRPGRDGVDCRMAVAQDAGIPLRAPDGGRRSGSSSASAGPSVTSRPCPPVTTITPCTRIDLAGPSNSGPLPRAGRPPAAAEVGSTR